MVFGGPVAYWSRRCRRRAWCFSPAMRRMKILKKPAPCRRPDEQQLDDELLNAGSPHDLLFRLFMKMASECLIRTAGDALPLLGREGGKHAEVVSAR